MELTEGNVRKAIGKKNTLAYLRSLPADHLFAPSSPCDCMYHDLLTAQFGVDYVWPSFDYIEAGEIEIEIDRRNFASRFQRAACDYLTKHGYLALEDETVYREELPRRNYERTISRDEAIQIAEGL